MAWPRVSEIRLRVRSSAPLLFLPVEHLISIQVLVNPLLYFGFVSPKRKAGKGVNRNGGLLPGAVTPRLGRWPPGFDELFVIQDVQQVRDSLLIAKNLQAIDRA